MNKITCFLLLFSIFGFAQNIQFADPDLLHYLTTQNCVDTNGDGVFNSRADFNNDGQIQLSEAQQVLRFKFSTMAHQIQDLGGFENFSNLEYLNVTTISVNHLDLSIWQSLQSVHLSTSIQSFVFNNPLLTHFSLQNTAFSNPLFDLTNLPSLEYVKVQSGHLTDNLIFGTHPNLEDLIISAGTFSSLNLSGMPSLKHLTIADFVGESLDISNCTLLEEFWFKYTDNLNSIIGIAASPYLEKIDFFQDGYGDGIPSNLDLAFNNQGLRYMEIRGAKSISVSNAPDLVDVELWSIDDSINFNNCSFNYVDSYFDRTLFIGEATLDQISLTNIDELRSLQFQNINIGFPLDLSTTPSETLFLTNCSIPELNMKNGNILQQFNSSYDTEIQFICIDREELNIVENGIQNPNATTIIHPYCTFVLGGDYYEITGDILVDRGQGCNYIESPIFDLQFTVTDGVNTDTFYSSNSNGYSYTLPEGNHTFNSVLLNSDLWSVSPSSIELDFPTDPSPQIQDFCITPNGTYNDVEVIIVPLNEGRPGFEASYKIFYKNKGTTQLSGNIELTFDGNVMEFLTASPDITTQTIGSLTWEYSGLLAFETREIYFSTLLNTPTHPDFPLMGGEVISYSVIVDPVVADETPEDNSFVLNQTVVNSFDPNDIRCLQGNTITPEQVGNYVHYLIRFENTGTANAVNVVVKDVLDTSKFEMGSFMPVQASHDFYTRIINGNEVEFIFENIDLPFNGDDTDGFVLFKIKTLPSLNLGDSFNNQAEIYFDFNSPIITNDEITVIEENLSTPEFGTDKISISPNPTNDILNIQSQVNVSGISIFDINGRLLKTEQPNSNASTYQIDVQNLTNGIYFLEVQTGNNKQVLKFIKS